MAPVNKCKSNRLLKSLQDGLSKYFQSFKTSRSLKAKTAFKRKYPDKLNLNKLKNINSNKRLEKKVISFKSKIKLLRTNEVVSKRPDEIKLLNDGLTKLYEVSDSKRLSLYRCIVNDDCKKEKKSSDQNKIINQRKSEVPKSIKQIEEENPSSKARKSQIQILRDGLTGYYSTSDQFRRTSCHHSMFKEGPFSNDDTLPINQNFSKQNSNSETKNQVNQEIKQRNLINMLKGNEDKTLNKEKILKKNIKKTIKFRVQNKGGKNENITKDAMKDKKQILMSINKRSMGKKRKSEIRKSEIRKSEIRKGLVKRAEERSLKKKCSEQLYDGLSNYFKISSNIRTRNGNTSKLSSDEDSVEYDDNHVDNDNNAANNDDSNDDNAANNDDSNDDNGNSNIIQVKNGRAEEEEEEEDSTEADDSKCHQLLGLFDGLSHLYCAGGSRLRKSNHFYKEGSHYNKHSHEKIASKYKVAYGIENNGRNIKSIKRIKDGKNVKLNLKEVIKRKYVRRYNDKQESQVRSLVKKKNSYLPSKFSKFKKIKTQRGIEDNTRFKCLDQLPQLTSHDKKLFKKATKKAWKLLDRMNDISSTRCNSNYPLFIELGQYEVATWFPSFYPGQFSMCCKLYICEFCLKYMQSQETLLSHLNKCIQAHPPGTEIYKHAGVSVWQVDGNISKDYCRNLCLLAKLFLQHKTLYLDVEPFLFYVLTLNDSRGSHMVGYFSKEKFCPQRFNLSCLMVLPQYQRQGYGRLLIHFSYLLTKKEGLFGSPEKPLSELGRLTYLGYWKSIIIKLILHATEPLSIHDISIATGMSGTDIVLTLEALHIIAILDDNFVIVVERSKLKVLNEDFQGRNVVELSEEHLICKPLTF